MFKKVVIFCLTFALVFGTTQFGIAPQASAVSAQKTVSFVDVPKNHWAASAIAEAVQAGYVSGYPDGTFRPSGTITRAEVAGMLSRVTKLVPEKGSDAFADLEGHWSREEVRQLVALGFIDPADYKNGFEPNKPATRYEVMKWIASGLAKSHPDFAQALEDTKDTLLPTPESFKGGISPEQVPYIAVVRGTGIIQGFEDGTMRPASTITRAEVVAIMLRYAEVEGTDPKKYRDLNELREVGLTGTNLTTITNYRYWPVDAQGTINDYNAVRDKPISMRNNKGIIKVHRMIVVDTTKDTGDGVYAGLFVDPAKPERIRNGLLKDYYLIYVEQTVIPNKDLERLEFSNATGNFLLPTRGYFRNFLEQKGFQSLPIDNPPKDFFAKGKVHRIWLQGVIFKNEPVGYDLRTDDGSYVDIRVGAKEG